nr:hypothetical protein [Marinicella sp. W31]MDC2879885.1 hypothetical protein [Marinicella sp. W31]
MSAEDGRWHIELGHVPRLYTIFEIWACDQQNGTSSPKVQFIYGGSQPKLSDVYASKTVAFGEIKGGNEISVYGPDGMLLGRDFTIGARGTWTVKFPMPVEAGDKICVIARRLTGATSLPLFITAKTFSVDDRNVAHVAGSGARPREKVQLFDRSTSELIAETCATDAGTWSVSFCKLLESGMSVRIRRLDPSGSTAQGPVFTMTTKRSLLPVIQYCGLSELSGIAASGLTVSCDQYRDGIRIASHQVKADSSNQWRTGNEFIHFKAGDNLVATTNSIDETAYSLVYSAVTIGEDRPNAPVVLSIDQNGASGTGEPGNFIVASTAEVGVFRIQTIADDNTWTIDWISILGTLPKSTIVYFVQFVSVESGSYSPTSAYVGRYADANGAVPDAPVIDGQDAVGAFNGIEETENTTVQIYNLMHQSMAIANIPALVQPDHSWVLAPDYPPQTGDEVWAEATAIGADGPGPTSPKSAYYTVRPEPQVGVPCPPEIQYAKYPYSFGMAQLDTWVTLTVTLPDESPQTVGPIATEPDNSWFFDLSEDFGGSFPSGTKFSATAAYGVSDAPSDPYVKVTGITTIGELTVETVSHTDVTGTAPVKNMVVKGWRGSDGKLLVDYNMPGDGTSFVAPYLDGMTLPDGDLLWLVCAYAGNESMTPFNRKQEGYVASDI